MLAQFVDKKTINNSDKLRMDMPAAEADLPLYYSEIARAAHILITTGSQPANLIPVIHSREVKMNL